MRKWWDREPVAIASLVEAAVVLGVAFGLPVTTDQLAAIVGFAIIVTAFVQRRSVYAPATIQDEIVFEADDEFLD